jgi:hypothetical protein
MKEDQMSLSRLSTIFALIMTTSIAHADEAPTLLSVPTQDVMLGGDPTLDACSTYGMVSGLKDIAGNFLALRSYPGTEGAILQKLENEQGLWLCDAQEGWIGVVIPSQTMDCGTSSPITDKRAYSGPCTSGWVYGKFVSPVAG